MAGFSTALLEDYSQKLDDEGKHTWNTFKIQANLWQGSLMI